MGFAAEDQLVIQCSRVKMSDAAINAASELLHQDLDWDYVLSIAVLHGVAPLFHYGLTQLGGIVDLSTEVPEAAWSELERISIHNRTRNKRLYRVIRDIFAAFEQAGVQAIGLKDLALVRTVYPDLGLRPMGDIDVLIRREDYEKVERCLTNLGFSPVPRRECPYLLRYAWALHFCRPTDDVWVDVQWDVLQLEWDVYGEGSFDFEIDRMWQGAQVLAIEDYQILQPRPEDMLFHLCMHFEGHRYGELILLCDIAEVIQYYGRKLDSSYLLDLAKRYRVETSVYYALLLVQRLFGSCVPGLLEELQPDYFKASLFQPLFGNLAELHGTLEDIRYTASPPADVMTRFEAVVRSQVAHSMRYYLELDQLAEALSDLGTSAIIFDGDLPQRLFPSQALPAFPVIRLCILERDRRRLQRALAQCGFSEEQRQGQVSNVKRVAFSSRDPVLVGTTQILEIRTKLIDDLKILLDPNRRKVMTKKELALKALSGVRAHTEDNSAAVAELQLVILRAEEMAAYLAAQAGRGQTDKLFTLCSLLELVRSYSGPLDWAQVIDIARDSGVESPVWAALLAAETLLEQPLPASEAMRSPSQRGLPRMLQWARYGPGSLERYTDFKGLFFCLLAFLSARGLGAKLRYLVGLSVGGLGKGALVRCGSHLLLLASGLLRAAWRGKSQYTAMDLAHWVKPEPTTGTLSQGGER